MTRASPCEACAAFTRVAARTLAPSPICDALHRRLQPFRHLHDCSGCFRLERSPGGALTHWKAPPSHGAHVWRTFGSNDRHAGAGGQRSSEVELGWTASKRRFIPNPVRFAGYRIHYPAFITRGARKFFLGIRSPLESKGVFQLRTSCIRHSASERSEG